MPNRAERRAQAKRNRRGVPQQYDQTQGRARSGMLDEYQLQEKSRRLQDGTDGPWKPSASTITETENVLNTNPDYRIRRCSGTHSVRQWFRVASLGADCAVGHRLPRGHVAAVASDVAHLHSRHRLRSRCAEPVLHGRQPEAQSESRPKRNSRLITKTMEAVRQPEAFVSPLFLSDFRYALLDFD